MESIIKCIASSIGSPISAKKIANALGATGRKISVNTVDYSLRALTDSFIFYKADIKGRLFLKTLGKYYLVDTCIHNLLVLSNSLDLGHLIKNVVYLELLRRGCKVNIRKLADKEVDFMASNTEGITYYQVSATVLDETILARELDPLRKINNHHPKMLLTLDEIGARLNYDVEFVRLVT